MDGLLQGIFYLHENENICHRDLTLDNVIYEEKLRTLKIIDFSISRNYKIKEKMWTKTGKIMYLAPEILN